MSREPGGFAHVLLRNLSRHSTRHAQRRLPSQPRTLELLMSLLRLALDPQGTWMNRPRTPLDPLTVLPRLAPYFQGTRRSRPPRATLHAASPPVTLSAALLTAVNGFGPFTVSLRPVPSPAHCPVFPTSPLAVISRFAATQRSYPSAWGVGAATQMPSTPLRPRTAKALGAASAISHALALFLCVRLVVRDTLPAYSALPN